MIKNPIGGWLVLFFFISGASAQDRAPLPPQPFAASEEGHAAIQSFKFPNFLKCELFAAEPDVANVVAIHRDYRGRLFACETFRQEHGVEDNRGHGHWLLDDLRAQTVQDRIDYIRQYIPDADESYTAADDRIRLLIDQDRDGKSDRSIVFSNHYNKIEMGTGAGVLSYRNDVYFTCIPDLFLLKDNDDDGVADVRESLHTGFGVRTAFRGHDLHGLIVGPDGRLYFSMADRGYCVSNTIHDPTSGAVFRCELDGSKLEVICTGLRNPQELAFDDFGNLFTADNNSDSGDKARWVYCVPGGDSGWRMHYQYLPDRGPFNREKIWQPFNELTPAYTIPPIDNLADGPSGLEYYPGTGLNDKYRGHFFLCDFRGGPTNSGIRSFRPKQHGAFWSLEDSEQPIWRILATDLDFGSDGKLYVSDWVLGWSGIQKGRIYTFFNPATIDSPIVKEVESLLRDGLKSKSVTELRALLAHADQRVRQEAQFELVARNDFGALKDLVLNSDDQLSRVHALWGLGQLTRNQPPSIATTTRPVFEVQDLIKTLTVDPDFEIRAQAAQLAADSNSKNAAGVLIPLLADENLRVRYYAALALSKIGDAGIAEPIVTMLVENADADPIVRHGGIMAIKHLLRNSGTDEHAMESALELTQHESSSVRTAAVVAIRKSITDLSGEYRSDAAVAALGEMLDDPDDAVFAEAVRAIHDLPVEPLVPALAATLDQLPLRLTGGIFDDAIIRRVLNANLRTGGQANADSLANFAANKSHASEQRIQALTALTHWMNPPKLDAVLNDWRPIETKYRNIEHAQNALRKQFGKLATAEEMISTACLTAASSLKLTGVDQILDAIVQNSDANSAVRTSALNTLNELGYNGIMATLGQLEAQRNHLPLALSATVADLLSARDATRGLRMIDKILATETQDLRAKQTVIGTLGRMSDPESAIRLGQALDDVISGKYPSALSLDVVLAAKNRPEENLKSKVAVYQKDLAFRGNPSDIYLNTLHGGNADAGEKIFVGKTEISCVRCHRIDGTGGNVGPDLSGVAIKNDRQYLLDSIVEPNKIITEGFGQIKVQTIDGLILTGLLVAETDEEIRLLDAEGQTIVIPADDVDGIKPGLSAMPADLVKSLTQTELRDLIEYLAQRKTPPKPEQAEGHD